MSRTRYRLEKVSSGYAVRGLLGAAGGAALGAGAAHARGRDKKRGALAGAVLGGAAGLGSAHILKGRAKLKARADEKLPGLKTYIEKQKGAKSFDDMLAQGKIVGETKAEKELIEEYAKLTKKHNLTANPGFRGRDASTDSARAEAIQKSLMESLPKSRKAALKSMDRKSNLALAAGGLSAAGAGAMSKEASDILQYAEEYMGSGALGGNALAAYQGVKEASADSRYYRGAQKLEKVSSVSDLYVNPEDSRQQRLNTLLRR